MDAGEDGRPFLRQGVTKNAPEKSMETCSQAVLELFP
jgi:hypothetical protein